MPWFSEIFIRKKVGLWSELNKKERYFCAFDTILRKIIIKEQIRTGQCNEI